jgi:hypothetical protein
MNKALRTEIEIDGSADQVWQVLTDFGAYPEWNPFITEAAGTARAGERLTVRLQPPGGRAVTIRPTILQADPGKRLRWLGRILMPGVFDGEHSFAIEPITDNRVRFVQQEQFRGLLVRLLARSLDRHTLPGFEQMNQALRARVERN